MQPHMATMFRMVVYAANGEAAQQAANAAWRRIADLDRIMTDYNPESELMRLCREPVGKEVNVSEDLFDVLQRARQTAEMTEGAFDFTVGPVIKLWRAARKNRVLPTQEAIAQAKRSVGYRKVELNARSRTVKLLVPDMRLDLGGIAKGYAADKALTVLRQHGIRSALVAASGDIALSDPPPGKRGWRISVGSPDETEDKAIDTLVLSNCGVSTSGDAEQFVVIEGVRYSHVVNPLTGVGLTERIQLTTVAPDATTSDALGKLSVLGAKGAVALADKLPKIAVLAVVPGAKGLELLPSRRFSELRAASAAK